MSEKPWYQALDRTRRAAFGRLSAALGATELTPDFWESLEAALIQADVGAALSDEIISDLQETVRREGYTRGQQVYPALKAALLERLGAQPQEPIHETPEVILLVGVNGSGKTTTAAKLAARKLAQEKTVLLAAADTYRAAAVEQLEIWGQRLNVEVISGQPRSDPGAVVFDASQAVKARNIDVLIVDTSGRMHTEHNLMAELEKIARVAAKAVDGAPHQTLLVMDATTGQNGLAQAKAFTERVNITGVVLAKLDSSAKGGVGLAITQTLKLPILYVGMGEQPEELALFDPQAYIEGLLASNDSP